MNFFINETFDNSNVNLINPDILNKNINYKRLITKILENINEQYFNSLKKLYTQPLTESSSNIFLDTNTFIIENFIKNLKDIKSVYKDSIKTFFSYNKDEINYIKKNKNSIFNFSGNSVKVTGYYFTEFKTPPVYMTNEIFDDMMKIFDHNIDEVYDEIKNKLMSGYFEVLRKDILELKNPIPKKEFSKRVYEYFRNGVGEPETISIGANYIKEYVDNLNQDKYISSVEDFIDEIIDQLECIKKVLNDFVKSEYIGNKKKLLDIMHPYNNSKSSKTATIYYELDDIEESLDESFNNYLFLILKSKSMQIVKIMEMYGEIISSKITAMNEAIVQNKFICIVLLDYMLNGNGGVN